MRAENEDDRPMLGKTENPRPMLGKTENPRPMLGKPFGLEEGTCYLVRGKEAETSYLLFQAIVDPECFKLSEFARLERSLKSIDEPQLRQALDNPEHYPRTGIR